MSDAAAGATAATPQFTVAAVARAVAAAIPDRELVTQGERRYTYGQILERSTRLTSYLHSRGLGCHTELSQLRGHEVGQDLIGLYAYNGNEFVGALPVGPREGHQRRLTAGRDFSASRSA